MEPIGEFDFVVVGAGTFGLSTAYFLALQFPAARIVLLEQFLIGHANGSSHSQSRIIRCTYPNTLYRDLCLLGINKFWPNLEKHLEKTFIEPNPCITIVEQEQAWKEYKIVADSSQGQLKELTSEELHKMFPSAPKVHNKFTNFLDTKSGVVFAERYILALTGFLREQSNVTILQNAAISSLKQRNGEVEVTGTHEGKPLCIIGKKVMTSCGRWIGELVPGMTKLTRPVRQVVSYLQMAKMDDYKIGKFPCWMHLFQSGTLNYGLPDVNGTGIKFGNHCFDDKMEFTFPNEAEYLKFKEEEIVQAATKYFGEGFMKINKQEDCYYTISKTEDFIIDWTKPSSNVLVCSPCSGHGFKFSPVIGKICSDLLGGKKTLELFENNREMFTLAYHEKLSET